MDKDIKSFTTGYLNSRGDAKSAFGYALMRRSDMLMSVAAQVGKEMTTVDAIDFGCADGIMLSVLAEVFGSRFNSGLGLDIFRAGIPESKDKIDFLQADLFRFPFAVQSESRDIAVVSAFIKHHPDPINFLGEISRILRPNGYAILLDPRPWVVKIGFRFKRFTPHYNPSLWGRDTMEKWAADERTNLRLDDYQRYWVAPTAKLYDAGLETVMPQSLRNLLALHQCAVLRKSA